MSVLTVTLKSWWQVLSQKNTKNSTKYAVNVFEGKEI